MLVGAPERWDEACFAVPAVRAVLAAGLGTGVICREDQREIWQSVTGLEVLAFPEKTKAKAVALANKDSWQAALLWEPGMAAEVIKLMNVPRQLGPANGKLRKQITQPLGISNNPLEHRVRFYLAAVEEMGITTFNPEFFAPVALGIERLTNAVLISPDSDFGPSHEWPLNQWLEITNRLITAGYQITVAGGCGGRGLGAAMATKLGPGVKFVADLLLGGALSLLAAQRVVIAADGSLPHLAAHVGATCVTLFGPNDGAWKRPLGRRHLVVWRHVECAPCLLAKCPLDMRCQRELTPDMVWAAVQEVLA